MDCDRAITIAIADAVGNIECAGVTRGDDAVDRCEHEKGTEQRGSPVRKCTRGARHPWGYVRAATRMKGGANVLTSIIMGHFPVPMALAFI